MPSCLKIPFKKGTRMYSLYLVFLKHAKKLNNGFVPDEEWAIQETERWKKKIKKQLPLRN